MTDEVARLEEAAFETPMAETAQLAALRARLVISELRTAAARAGMIDLDGVKLVDTSTLSVNDDGVLEAADSVIATLREEKPFLFGRSSSSSATAPRVTPAMPKSAMDMSAEEWRVARAELLRRR